MAVKNDAQDGLVPFLDLWADLTASFIESLNPNYSNPFSDFPHLRMIECKVAFDFQGTPYLIMIEGERS